MTDTAEMIDPVTGEIIDERQLAEQLLAQARVQGVGLVGRGGLLAGLTKTVLETALEAEMTEPAAQERFEEFDAKWGDRYPAISRLWRNAWAEFAPFLDWDVEIRRVVCSTNAIESLNARYRRAVRARGHFPNDAAALKCLYLATRSLDPTGRGRARWATRWKPALNAFAIAFEGRIN